MVPVMKSPTVLAGLMNCAALAHAVQVTTQKRISIDAVTASDLDTSTNLARASGFVAFGSSSLGGYCSDTGAGTGTRSVSGIHCWDNVFDGLLGNSYSWIPGVGNGFVGVRLPSVATIDGFRVSRKGSGSCCNDRIGGTYEIQYTLDEADHTTSSWTSTGTFTRGSYGFLYYKFSSPVTARSFRLIASSSGACIDEWELYGSAGGGAAAVGDPHLQNVHGERFDLMKPGKHVLINIPRGASAEKSLLRVQADARQLGGQCADMYFQELNVTGSWAETKQVGGYHYSVSQRDVETPTWIAFGKVGLKVVHGRTNSGLSYLNVYVKHLGQSGFAVGGLLGEDDHADVITPPEACVKSLSLVDGVEGGQQAPLVLSVAEASLA